MIAVASTIPPPWCGARARTTVLTPAPGRSPSRRASPPGSSAILPTLSRGAGSAPRSITTSSASTARTACSTRCGGRGPKGEGQFERVSWDDALSDIAARLQAIIASDGPHRHPALQLRRFAGASFRDSVRPRASSSAWAPRGWCVTSVPVPDRRASPPHWGPRRGCCRRTSSTAG